ncbi:putative MFS transporter [Leucosporidium creatinivorum]|uniref:Putative MFS transporter n=1 Tax=Leucosporidium creatinivorum TaxID=106004 RepID=A0A1Y2G0A9_9BASI|nr:putative MFS transporter [Leucosporidium creatinivorum]
MFKIYITVLACAAVFLSNYLAAGPTVSIVSIAIEYTGLPPDIPKTAYLFTTSALWQGAGMFLWSPLIAKIGKRPIYVISFVFFFLCAVWAALAKSYPTELVARMGIGLFSGGAECLAPLTITDLFFVHERGTYLGFYQVFLSIGVSVGIIIAGIIADRTGNWRLNYWVGAAFIGFIALLVIFTFPETSYRRGRRNADKASTAERTEAEIPALKSWPQRLALWSGIYTQESFWKIFIRPFGLVLLPAVLWATLVFAGTIGFLVAITSNFSVALGAAPYNFTPLQSALCFVGGLVGGLVGIPVAGHFGDWVARRNTRLNDGIREPEHRLPAVYPHIVLGPLALILYGLGIEQGLHWMVPTLGLALLSFTIVGATNQAFAYAIDCFKPIAGEVVVCILGYKAIIGFGLSFGTNSWVALEGYLGAFGQMAAISGFFLALSIPFAYFGGAIRQASFQWRLTSWIQWDADRDDVQVVLH